MATGWRPNIRQNAPSLERLALVGNSAFHTIKSTVSNQLSLQVHITNGTSETLRFESKDVSSPSTQCDIKKGWEVQPSRAGSMRFSDNMHLRFTVYCTLDDEKLCINAHISSSGMKCFNVDFHEEVVKRTSYFKVIGGMPEFMGFGSCSNQAEGNHYIATVLHVYEDRSQIHIYLGEKKEEKLLQSFSDFLNSDSWQQLRFAEWCVEHDRNLLGNVLFLAEFSAVEKGLPGTLLEDQAFTLDLLAATFVTTGILNVSGEVLEASLQMWKPIPGASDSRVANRPKYTNYCTWAAQKDSQVEMEKHIAATRMLLLVAARACAAQLRNLLEQWKGGGTFNEKRVISSTSSTGSAVAEGTDIRAVASAAADAIKALQPPDTFQLGLIKSLVVNGISQAKEYAQKREKLLAAIKQEPNSTSAATALQYYYNWLPLSERLFVSEKDSGRIELFSPEVFSDLDSSQPTDIKTVWDSLKSVEFLEDMKTNSMSGELFYHSTDNVFMVKTISKPEGKLLRKMVPSYQAHVKSEPRSFMCRYAGLFRIEAPGFQSRYFVVMRSVFDPRMKEGLEVFDLKGTLVNRKKSEGQSCGKDQDWVDQHCVIKVHTSVRSEVCAVHARDVAFLLRFDVMDYSMLVGRTTYCGDATCSSGWRQGGGLVNMEDKNIYFMGLIDHLVEYDMLRDLQNLLEGDEAEIVPPDRYAARQIKWFREYAVQKLDPEDDWGTFGRLRVQNIQGFNIKGYQDPSSNLPAGVAAKTTAKLSSLLHRGITTDVYVIVTVGLRSARTEVKVQDKNPVFPDTLYIPVDATRENEMVLVEVWQEVTAMLLGDRLVGKLLVPLQELLDAPGEPNLVQKERLRETAARGHISLELVFESGEQGAAAAAAAAAAAEGGRCVRTPKVSRAATTVTPLPECCTIC